jgi:hypothetical protein
MKRHPTFTATVVEFDIKRRHVSLEGQPGWDLSSTITVRFRVVRYVHGKLTANREVAVIGYVLNNPSSITERISIIKTLSPITGAI